MVVPSCGTLHPVIHWHKSHRARAKRGPGIVANFAEDQIISRSVNHSVRTGQSGRLPVCLNINMVEFLHNAGYTWSEVAKALLVSRTI